MNRAIFVGLALIAVLAAFALGRLCIPAELYGWDSYPLIAASKFDSVGAFFGTFTEELMDGRYPAGSFYRPVLHLMLGVEHGLGGLSPAVYGGTDVAVAILAALAVGIAALRMGLHPVGAALASAFIVLNPVSDNVVWFLPRRPESLSLLFIAAAIAIQRPGEAGSRRRIAATVLVSLLAVGSKESGVLVVPLLFVLHASAASPVKALRASTPAILATAGFLIVRTAVLGGMGGHPESSVANLGHVGTFALGQLRSVFGTAGLGNGVWLALAPLGAGALFLLARRGEVTAQPIGLAADHPTGRARVWVPLIWLAGHFALSALSGVEQDWYAYQALAPVGLLGGAIVSLALFQGVATSGIRKVAGVVLALGAFASLATPIATAKAPVDRTGVNAGARATLDLIEKIVEAVPLGGAATLEGWRPRLEAQSMVIFLHAPYSLNAYAELLGAPKTACFVGNPPARPIRITVTLRQ